MIENAFIADDGIHEDHTFEDIWFSLNFTHMCRHTCVFAHLKHAKLKNWHVHTLFHAILACSYVWASEDTRHTRDACHELALGLPHYMCGVVTGTITVDNEMKLFCSWLATLYYYVAISIAWKSYWRGVVLPNMLVSLVDKIKYCTA